MGSKSVVLLLFTFVFQVAYAQLQLQAVITTEKATYYVSEPIYFRLVLKNTLDTLIQFDDHQITRHLQIWDQNNNQLELTFKMQNGGNYLFLPHDSLVIISDITGLFGIYGPKNKEVPHGISKGVYTVQFKMKQQGIFVESNQLRITIIPPSAEELRAFTLYNEAWFKLTDRSFSREEYKKNLRKLAEEHPNSVYAPIALSIGTPYSEKDKAHSIHIINQYPNRYFTTFNFSILLSLYKSEKDKQGAEIFLREIISKSPGTFAAQEAQYWLAKIEPLTIEEWLNPELVTERRLKEYYEKRKKH